MILHNYKALLGGVAVSLVTAPCAIADLPIEVNVVNEEQRVTTPYYSEWPSLESAIVKDPQIEARIADILSRMTLGEKVGQMIMPEYRQVTPAEAKQYKIGSVLNGGGGWPNEDKYATAQEWAKQADSYWLALDEAYAGRGFRIPFMWATDAVHGHNNVYGATLFPHNIGLGAANNPDLLRQIGEVTAIEVAATGIDLTFAPTVAVPRDYRWGRVYEGYSESPDITYHYAPAIVEGLQGNQQQLQTESKVIATVKHWLGDGGTNNGVDRGINHSTEDQLRNLHALGYFSAIEAGAQVVMTSFNSWQQVEENGNIDSDANSNHSGKLHGSRYLVTDVLKGKLGFDGIVVTDWNGHGEVKGCTNANCPQAVLAGNDLFMVTDNKDWKGFYRNVIKQVRSGEIPMSRIDDAVTRILRVKMRAGLWFKPRPSYRLYAGDESLLGADKHRLVARQAVSESLVLLKNNNQILPLNSNNQTYLVVGSASNDLQKQSGGWTLTWQGNENRRSDYKNGETVLEAFVEQVGEKRVFTDPETAPMDAIAVVVMGEDPYAEMFGDIKEHQSIAYSELKASYKRDLRLLEQLKEQGFEVVTLFFSGRPLYTTPELNLSDAFVAAWLPGTEAMGITDVLFGVNGKDFTGRLSFSWPRGKCVSNVSRFESRIPDYVIPENELSPEESPPLFEYGYGLSYQKAQHLNEIELDKERIGCGKEIQKTKATHNLEIFGRLASDQFVPKVSGQVTQWKGTFVSRSKVTEIGTAHTTPINYKHQQDALSVSLGQSLPMQFYLQTPDKKGVDLTDYLFAGADLEFDIAVYGSVPKSLKLASHCVYPCGAIASIEKELSRALENNNEPWLTVKVPLSCLAENGLDFSDLNTPLLLYADEPFDFEIGEVRYVPESQQVDDKRALYLSCGLFNKIK
ncbi:glycoside hydrolase family 3 protein [Vibrio sp. THAF190c]|uniref:glycoside hydrolase family 3 protein n=1 Tax=Vibrio sp. THAF190c TaxID=2587865 RepID=UPI0012AA74A4|nr:glycoside hydrolase family 3 protein [Vibrio sp. THAF190c]QFT09893.1 Periplasmic beta-glucosidase precursor [Vibrio sp. THAF190c]